QEIGWHAYPFGALSLCPGMRRLIDAQKLRGVDLGVALGGRERGVAEQFLDGTEIATTGQQMGGEGMAEGMRCRRFRKTQLAAQALHRALHLARIQRSALDADEEDVA